jgi:hypothetical protein
MEIDNKLRVAVAIGCEKLGTLAPSQELKIEDLVVTVMRTLENDVQQAHQDFKPRAKESRTLPNERKLGDLEERHRQEDLGFYPISPEGMLLFVWAKPTGTGGAVNKPELIHIPYGYMLVMRGTVTHAGGIMTPGSKFGNLRVHLYIKLVGKIRKSLSVSSS